MSSLNSGVLRQPFLADDAHMIGSTEQFYIDPMTAKRTEDAREAGYEHGFADGAKAAEAAARRSAEAAAERLAEGVSQAVATLSETTVGLVPVLMDTAISIARYLVASVPEELAATLTGRLRDALAQIDDDALTIFVSPADHGEVQAGISSAPTLTLAIDSDLSQGEARVEGTWAHADLTLPTAWRLIEEALRG